MEIRDRGLVKWQAAFQLPELAKTQCNFWRDNSCACHRPEFVED